MSEKIDKLNLLLIFLVSVATFISATYFIQGRYDSPDITIDSAQIDQEVFDKISMIYVENKDEFVVCMYGTVEGSKAHITEYKRLELDSASSGTSTFTKCRKYPSMGSNLILSEFVAYVQHKIKGGDVILGAAHNHVNGACTMSNTDIYTFGRLGYALNGIICGENTIKIYTSENLRDGFDAVKG